MKTISSTKKQNAMIGYQINRLKIDTETKEELIYLHTDGRTTRISELQFDEASKIIKALTSGNVEYHTPKEKMVRKILSMAHELNWEYANGQVNMKRVNEWCIKYGYLHKPLDQYTANELPQLVTSFEGMYFKHLKGV